MGDVGVHAAKLSVALGILGECHSAGFDLGLAGWHEI